VVVGSGPGGALAGGRDGVAQQEAPDSVRGGAGVLVEACAWVDALAGGVQVRVREGGGEGRKRGIY